jgi:hypothetical protein
LDLIPVLYNLMQVEEFKVQGLRFKVDGVQVAG